MISRLTCALRESASRYLFKHDDYGALRRRLGAQISARSTEADILDYVTAELAHVLNADAVMWEPITGKEEIPSNAIAVPSENEAKYQLRVHGLGGGGRGHKPTRVIPQNVVELIEYAAKLAGRQIDVVHTGEYRIQPASRRTSKMLFVTLGYELGRVREQFATLQQTVTHHLYLAMDVPGELWNVKLPPYVLQPLVDNAVRHGIAPQHKDGRVMISATVCDGELVIAISDTGDGFIPSANGIGNSLRQLRATLSEYYGCEATLRLDSLAGYGTTASINLPMPFSSQ